MQQVVIAALALPPRDKLELLQIIASDLQRLKAPAEYLAEASAAFWSLRSIDELVRIQAVPVIADIRTLAVDFWPENESADDINEFIAESRRADLMGQA